MLIINVSFNIITLFMKMVPASELEREHLPTGWICAGALSCGMAIPGGGITAAGAAASPLVNRPACCWAAARSAGLPRTAGILGMAGLIPATDCAPSDEFSLAIPIHKHKIFENKNTTQHARQSLSKEDC